MDKYGNREKQINDSFGPFCMSFLRCECYADPHIVDVNLTKKKFKSKDLRSDTNIRDFMQILNDCNFNWILFINEHSLNFEIKNTYYNK